MTKRPCLFLTNIPRDEAYRKCKCKKCVESREFHGIKSKVINQVRTSSRFVGSLDSYNKKYSSSLKPPKRYTLYRFWGDDGQLLYVGMTRDFYYRTRTHERQRDWWTSVISITLEHYPNIQDLRNAELKAINQEKPKYNLSDLQGVVVSSHDTH